MLSNERYRHLDHGYTLGWGANVAGLDNPVDRPHLVESLHASLQYYPPKYFRPSSLREIVPGACVAVHVQAGRLALRIFRLPAPELIKSRVEYFMAAQRSENDKALRKVVNLGPGEMM